MTAEQINDLLSDVISAYAPKFGRAFTREAARRLVTLSVEGHVENIAGNTYALAKTAFSKCGVILEERAEYGIISGVILSGAANMNPAYVLLWVEHDNIYLKASAKEGLIKQHTAERAIERFKSAFGNGTNK